MWSCGPQRNDLESCLEFSEICLNLTVGTVKCVTYLQLHSPTLIKVASHFECLIAVLKVGGGGGLLQCSCVLHICSVCC